MNEDLVCQLVENFDKANGRHETPGKGSREWSLGSLGRIQQRHAAVPYYPNYGGFIPATPVDALGGQGRTLRT